MIYYNIFWGEKIFSFEYFFSVYVFVLGATFLFTLKEMMTTSKRTKSCKDNYLRNEFQNIVQKLSNRLLISIFPCWNIMSQNVSIWWFSSLTPFVLVEDKRSRIFLLRFKYHVSVNENVFVIQGVQYCLIVEFWFKMI